MPFSANVKIDGDHEYSVMFMQFELHQTVDDAMSITSPIQWAHLYMELEMVLDDFLVEWANKPSQKYDLTVEQFGETGSFKTLSFKEAVCIEFVEMFDDGTDDLDKALANRDDTLFFDAGSTQMRAELLTRAIDAGKHVYCEKPISETLDVATKLARHADARGIRHGVVQDKLFLPGLQKIRMLRDSGFFGRIFSVRGEFGYWVFEGDWGQPAQRPSWNYRKADGGGIILDMLCHWRYVLDSLFGEVEAVSCLGATHIPTRVDEKGQTYTADADDAATEEMREEPMGFEQQDQQAISPALDTDANGIEDTEEGVSDQDPDSTETGPDPR